MTIETVDIAGLSLDPANARKHGPRNVEAIKASLRRFGQQRPIVVDSGNVVRAGNGTLKAAKELGWTQIQIVRSDLPPSELTAYAIADNRTAELAEWDDEVLKLQLPDVGDVGFTEAEIKALSGDVHVPDVASFADRFQQQYGVIVVCQSEAEQQAVYERLKAEGLNVKVVVT